MLIFSWHARPCMPYRGALCCRTPPGGRYLDDGYLGTRFHFWWKWHSLGLHLVSISDAVNLVPNPGRDGPYSGSFSVKCSLIPLILRMWVLLGLLFIRTGKGGWKSESYKISKNFNQMCLNPCYKFSHVEFTESFNWSVHAYVWTSCYQGSPRHVKSRWVWHNPQFVKTNFSMPSIYTYSQKTCFITSFNAGHFTVLHVLFTFYTEWSLRGNLFFSFDFHKRPPRQDLVVTARFYQRRKRLQHNKQASWNRILNIPLLKNFLSNSDFDILAALNFPVFFSPFFHLVNNPSLCTIAFGVAVLRRIFQLILWFVVSFLVLLESMH